MPRPEDAARALGIVGLLGLGLVACTPAIGAAPPREPRTANVDDVRGNALDVEPGSTPPMPAPSTPQIGFVVDDHLGAHDVPRERALQAIARYETHALLRVRRANRDEVTFEILGGDGVRFAKFFGALGQIDPAMFPSGKLFVGGLAIDPTGHQDAGAWAIVPVASADEGNAVLDDLRPRMIDPY